MLRYISWCFGAQLTVLTLVLCCTLLPSPTQAYISAHYSNTTSMFFEDMPALFGAPIPEDGLRGVLVESRPLNGCTTIDPPPPLPLYAGRNITKFIVLIRRYDCNFDIKVLHAQQAGYSAAIIHNMYSETLLSMNSSNETIADEINISSVFTSYYASKMLKNFIISVEGTYVILKPDIPFPLSYYFIPFAGVVGMIMPVMFVNMAIHRVQYRKRLRNNRLSKAQLKQIPIHKFRKGDDYDVCAICLDVYEEGDKMRVLPCSHAYHCKCVDPWLTQNKKTCPVCKQRVTRKNPEQHSESESEEEAGRPDVGTDTERTPLLRPSNPASPTVSPGSYAATITTTSPPVTTAQCLSCPAQCDSPILGYEGYYSPQEDTDSDSEDTGEETPTRTTAPLSSLADNILTENIKKIQTCTITVCVNNVSSLNLYLDHNF